jgi:beta-1,3-galactosyltransferase 1
MDPKKSFFIFNVLVVVFVIFVGLSSYDIIDIDRAIFARNETAENKIRHQHGVTMKIRYLLEKPELCMSVLNLSVVVIVHTAPKNRERRQTIRETWANNSYYTHHGTARILFLLGAVKNISLQAEIVKEFKENEDMLQGDFIDDYHNLTYKGVMAYRWLTEKCRNAKIVLKVDDDVIVNMFKFFTSSTFMPSFLTKTKFMACRRFHRNIIVRNRKSKWFVNKTILVNQTRYPDYCQGFVVIFTNDLIPALYQSALETAFLWIDDVYLYGMVPGNIAGIQYRHLRYGKEVIFGDKQTIQCHQTQKQKCSYLVSMFRSNVVSTIRESWRLIVENYRNASLHHKIS